MTIQTIGELASVRQAYGVRCEMALERGTWIVRIGEGIAAHADIDIAVEAAVVMMASLAGRAVA